MAAGLGFKTFNTGDVLSASDVNGYLMQGVLVFADTTARDAAITSPQEGQFAFTKNNDSLWYYNGTSWVASGATGDIEGVTAGTGISGGGTSGTVTITNSMATAIDAKGDLIVGTGADTFSRLAVGTNGHTIVADSSEATGLKWAAPAAGGMTLLSTTTLSGTSTLISSVNQGYNSLLIIIKKIDISSGTNAYVRIEPNSTANETAYANVYSTTSTIQTQGDSTFAGMILAPSQLAASNTNNAWALEIYDYASTNSYKPFNLTGTSVVHSTNAVQTINSSGAHRSNTEITEFRVYSGNASSSFNGGTVLIYGVK